MTQAPVRGRTALPLIWVLISPLVPTSMRYLSGGGMDNLSQNFVRYSAGIVPLVVVTLVWFRPVLWQVLRSPRLLLHIGALAGVGLVLQYSYVAGIELTSAAMGGIIGALGIPLTVVSAAVIYHDERATARSPLFIAGALLAVAGTVTVTLHGPPHVRNYSAGILWLLLATFGGTGYGLLMKSLVKDFPPLVVGTLGALMMWVAFGLAVAVTGRLGHLTELSPGLLAMAVGSGIVGLGLGFGIYSTLVQRLGVSIITVLGLSIPALTAAVAWVLIGDVLTTGQIVGGLIVIAGCGLAFRDHLGQVVAAD